MLKRIWQLISTTFIIWGDAKASRMSAALTYYTMLSLAPLLMIAIAIAGYVYDDQVAQAEILRQVELITSPGIADQVRRLIKNAVHPGSGIVAGTISLCIFVFAASGVFTQVYDTFNDIWNVSLDHRNGFLLRLEKRLLGVGMVLVVGIMLTAALVLNSAVAYISTLVGGHPRLETWISVADRSLSFLLMPFIFSVIFWFFPATKIQWRDVWPAGILTAVLIGASRYLIGMYLQFSTTSEVYGVSGSLVVLLIWVYMTGMVVFFGASFSHAWANTFGSRSDWGSANANSDEIDAKQPDEVTRDESGEATLEEPVEAPAPLIANTKVEVVEQGKNDQPVPLTPKRRSTLR